MPKSRMGRFTLVLISLWLLRVLLLPAAVLQSLAPALQLALDLLTVLLAVPAVFYTWRLFALV